MSNHSTTTTIDAPVQKSRQQNFREVCRAIVEHCPWPLANMYWKLAVRRWETDETRRQTRFNENVHRSIGSPVRVVTGPFKDMEYGLQAGCGAWLPRILGVYEKELTQVIEDVVASGIREIVDVGAAEGYYAVGFAKRMPNVRITCFECESYYRHLCRKLASINAVANQLNIQNECTPQTLRDATQNFGHWFLLCDCEGFEDQLLDSESVPSLRNAWILVETHDFCSPGVTDRIMTRFNTTHDIKTIRATERTCGDWHFGENVPVMDRLRALNEFRPASQTWLNMSPKPRP